MRVVGGIAIVAAALGCGHASDAGRAPAAPAADRAAMPPRDGDASAAVSVLDALRADAVFAGVLKVKPLRESFWFPAALAVPSGRVQETISAWRRTCGADPLALVDELAWSFGGPGQLLVVGRLAAPAETALACVRELSGGWDAEIGDRPALRIGSLVALVREGHLVAGSEEWVGELLAGRAEDRHPLAASHAADGVVLRFDGVVDGVRASGEIRDAAERLTIKAEVAPKDEAAAHATAARLEAFVANALQLSPEPLRPEVALARRGATVRVDATATSDASKMTTIIAVLSQLGVASVESYMTHVKTSAARTAFRGIVRALAVYVANPVLSGGRLAHRFPASAPPVPARVPRGRHLHSRNDWQHASWRAIDFSMTGADYFQYAFLTSPDGRTCVVTARGDPDGDGAETILSVELTLRGSELQAAPMVSSGDLD